MGKKSKPPPPPDYAAAAEKTGQSQADAQMRADWANRATQNTPWGTVSWESTQAIDPATGKPVTKWTQNTTLAGDQQKALDDQMAIQSGRSDIAKGMMSRLASDYANPTDWSKFQAYGQAPTAGQFQGYGNIQQGVGGTGLDSRMRLEQGMMDRMRPEHQFQQSGLETQLANQGLARGSAAWNREMQRLGDQQSRERFNALDRGLQEQQGQFGMNLQAGQFANQAQAQGFGQGMGLNQQNFGQGMQVAQYQNQLRQQQIQEELMRRGTSLNEMNALLSGQQVNTPQFGNYNTSQAAGAVNYSNAAQQQYNADMGQYNAQQQGQQGMMSGLGSVVSTGMMLF